MAARPPSRAAVREDDPLPPEHDCAVANRENVAALYRQHGQALLRFLARQAGRQVAPDLLNRVFARFLGLAPDKRDAIISAEAYLKASARNIVRDERKLADRHAAGGHVPDTDVNLTAPCQVKALEARDMLNRIEASIGKLKPVTRQIFLAHRLDGYSYREIAERTGLSVKAIEKHMSRAIAHLDRTLSAR